eukprot:1952682-Amphidinium_carterae.1
MKKPAAKTRAHSEEPSAYYIHETPKGVGTEFATVQRRLKKEQALPEEFTEVLAQLCRGDFEAEQKSGRARQHAVAE